jgi:aspartate kinase
MMNREVGFGVKLLSILAEEGVSFETIPAGVDNMSVIIRDAQFTDEVKAKVFARIHTELKVDELAYEGGLAIIMAVGEGMRGAAGVAARIMQAIADADVSIEMINQGSSEISMMFGIRSINLKTAVRALYHELFA